MTAIRNDMDKDGKLDDLPEGDPSQGRWSQLEMLIASLIDEIRGLRYVYTAVHSEKGKAGKVPAPVPRPGVKRRPKSRLTHEQRMMLDPRLRGEGDGGRA